MMKICYFGVDYNANLFKAHAHNIARTPSFQNPNFKAHGLYYGRVGLQPAKRLLISIT